MIEFTTAPGLGHACATLVKNIILTNVPYVRIIAYGMDDLELFRAGNIDTLELGAKLANLDIESRDTETYPIVREVQFSEFLKVSDLEESGIKIRQSNLDTDILIDAPGTHSITLVLHKCLTNNTEHTNRALVRTLELNNKNVNFLHNRDTDFRITVEVKQAQIGDMVKINVINGEENYIKKAVSDVLKHLVSKIN